MTSQRARLFFSTTIAFSFALGLFSSLGASAATPSAPAAVPAVDDDAPTAGPGAGPVPEPATVAPASVTPTAPPVAEPGIPVQQNPASAYPDGMDGGLAGKSYVLGNQGVPTRGIVGGSMWLTFHGLQWPYLPETGIGVSGSVWVDSGYETLTRPSGGNLTNERRWVEQGRAVLRVTPTYTRGRLFLQAQLELVANSDQTISQTSGQGLADTDDLWVRVGYWNRWDVQFGKFESWEVFHLGMGLDLNTQERRGAYDSNHSLDMYLVGGGVRPSGVGNVAFHIYPTSFLRGEIVGVNGSDTNNGLNSLGGRPAAILDLGPFKFKVAYEYIKSTSKDSLIVPSTADPAMTMMIDNPVNTVRQGYGGGAQLVLGQVVELGANFAHESYSDHTRQGGDEEPTRTFVETSVGGFANVQPTPGFIVGGGAVWTTKRDEDFQGTTQHSGYFAHLQGFVAVQYMLASRFMIKAVGSYARLDNEAGSAVPSGYYSDYMYSGRLRVMYLF